MRSTERFEELRTLVAAARSRAVRRLQTFNDELTTFANEFNQYTEDASRAILDLANGAYRKLAEASTAWLSPALAVYRVYVQRRTDAQKAGTFLQGGLAKPFDDWTNFATDVQASRVDLRIDLEVPLVDLGAVERLFDTPFLNDSALAAANSSNFRRPPPLLSLPSMVFAETTLRTDDDAVIVDAGASASSPASVDSSEPSQGSSSGRVDFLTLVIAVAVLCDLVLFSSRFVAWKASANYALNGYPILLNTDADTDCNGDANDKNDALLHTGNGGVKQPEASNGPHQRPRRAALSVVSTLVERDWLIGIAALVVAFFALDLVNVATDRLADGRVLNARFGIYSRLLDPVSAYDELSSASLNEYKSFVLDRYLAVYEDSLNNDLRLLEAFRTAWSIAKYSRRDAIRKLVSALDGSETSDSERLKAESLASWSAEIRSNLSRSCRFDELIIDEADRRSTRLVTQSEFDYNVRLANLVDSGEVYFNELRLLVRRTTFLLFVYIATMICFTFISRFCEMFCVRFHFARLRFVYTSAAAN